MAVEDPVFAVIEILDTVLNNDRRYYKVKWADSWEPEENLTGCPKLINAYWDTVNREKREARQFKKRKRRLIIQSDDEDNDNDTEDQNHKEPNTGVNAHNADKRIRVERSNNDETEQMNVSENGIPTYDAMSEIGEPPPLDEINAPTASVQHDVDTLQAAGNEAIQEKTRPNQRLVGTRSGHSDIVEVNEKAEKRPSPSLSNVRVKEEPVSDHEEQQEAESFKRTAKIKAGYNIRKLAEHENSNNVDENEDDNSEDDVAGRKGRSPMTKTTPPDSKNLIWSLSPPSKNLKPTLIPKSSLPQQPHPNTVSSYQATITHQSDASYTQADIVRPQATAATVSPSVEEDPHTARVLLRFKKWISNQQKDVLTACIKHVAKAVLCSGNASREMISREIDIWLSERISKTFGARFCQIIRHHPILGKVLESLGDRVLTAVDHIVQTYYTDIGKDNTRLAEVKLQNLPTVNTNNHVSRQRQDQANLLNRQPMQQASHQSSRSVSPHCFHPPAVYPQPPSKLLQQPKPQMFSSTSGSLPRPAQAHSVLHQAARSLQQSEQLVMSQQLSPPLQTSQTSTHQTPRSLQQPQPQATAHQMPRSLQPQPKITLHQTARSLQQSQPQVSSHEMLRSLQQPQSQVMPQQTPRSLQQPQPQVSPDQTPRSLQQPQPQVPSYQTSRSLPQSQMQQNITKVQMTHQSHLQEQAQIAQQLSQELHQNFQEIQQALSRQLPQPMQNQRSLAQYLQQLPQEQRPKIPRPGMPAPNVHLSPHPNATQQQRPQNQQQRTAFVHHPPISQAGSMRQFNGVYAPNSRNMSNNQRMMLMQQFVNTINTRQPIRMHPIPIPFHQLNVMSNNPVLNAMQNVRSTPPPGPQQAVMRHSIGQQVRPRMPFDVTNPGFQGNINPVNMNMRNVNQPTSQSATLSRQAFQGSSSISPNTFQNQSAGSLQTNINQRPPSGGSNHTLVDLLTQANPHSSTTGGHEITNRLSHNGPFINVSNSLNEGIRNAPTRQMLPFFASKSHSFNIESCVSPLSDQASDTSPLSPFEILDATSDIDSNVNTSRSVIPVSTSPSALPPSTAMQTITTSSLLLPMSSAPATEDISTTTTVPSISTMGPRVKHTNPLPLSAGRYIPRKSFKGHSTAIVERVAPVFEAGENTPVLIMDDNFNIPSIPPIDLSSGFGDEKTSEEQDLSFKESDQTSSDDAEDTETTAVDKDKFLPSKQHERKEVIDKKQDTQDRSLVPDHQEPTNTSKSIDMVYVSPSSADVIEPSALDDQISHPNFPNEIVTTERKDPDVEGCNESTVNTRSSTPKTSTGDEIRSTDEPLNAADFLNDSNSNVSSKSASDSQEADPPSLLTVGTCVQSTSVTNTFTITPASTTTASTISLTSNTITTTNCTTSTTSSLTVTATSSSTSGVRTMQTRNEQNPLFSSISLPSVCRTNSNRRKSVSFVPENDVPKKVRSYLKNHYQTVLEKVGNKKHKLGNKLHVHMDGSIEIQLVDGETFRIRYKDLVKRKYEREQQSKQSVVVDLLDDEDDGNDEDNDCILLDSNDDDEAPSNTGTDSKSSSAPSDTGTDPTPFSKNTNLSNVDQPIKNIEKPLHDSSEETKSKEVCTEDIEIPKVSDDGDIGESTDTDIPKDKLVNVDANNEVKMEDAPVQQSLNPDIFKETLLDINADNELKTEDKAVDENSDIDIPKEPLLHIDEDEKEAESTANVEKDEKGQVDSSDNDAKSEILKKDFTNISEPTDVSPMASPSGSPGIMEATNRLEGGSPAARIDEIMNSMSIDYESFEVTSPMSEEAVTLETPTETSKTFTSAWQPQLRADATPTKEDTEGILNTNCVSKVKLGMKSFGTEDENTKKPTTYLNTKVNLPFL